MMRKCEPDKYHCPHCGLSIVGMSCAEWSEDDSGRADLMDDTPVPWEGAWSVCESCIGLMRFIDDKWIAATSMDLNVESRGLRRRLKQLQRVLVIASGLRPRQ